jgi:hypothetical protein
MSLLAGLRHFLHSHTEMSSSRNQNFPAVPPNLNAGDYELKDYYPDQGPAPPNTIPQYTPYLGLRARLSQVWINRWTILLLLVLCRLLLAVRDTNYDVANAKEEALSACTSVENVGSAMASMPFFLAQGVNALTADGVTNAVNGLMNMLMLTVSGVEEIVLFVINMMTSTYVCLITLAITGSLEVAIQMIEDVGAFMNKSINGLTGDLSTSLSSFQTDFNDFVNTLNIGGGLLGASQSVPTLNITNQINALNDIQVDPTTMDSDLTKLNASLPTFAQVQNFTNTVISLPFDEVKKLINQTMATYTFDQSVFPVPQKQALTFCSDNSVINDFFDGLVKVLNTAQKAFIAVLVILAVLACVPMAYREIWSWRSMKQRSLLLQKSAFDPMDVLYIASRPYTSTFGIKLSSRFKGTKQQILTRWVVAYATSLPALFVLALGLTGLFSCLCQFIILKTLEKEVPVLANEVDNFADSVVSALNNASESWAVSANSVINSTNSQLNSDVFGWVNTTTSAINGTLDAFTSNMTSALNETFGGTILYQPILGVFNCLIGLKIASFEKGLTWVSDNAKITFPEFRTDVFSLGAAQSLTNGSTDSFLSSPGSVASSDITSAVVKVANKLESGIRDEAIISTCIVALWFFIVLCGIVHALFAMSGRDKTRAEGGLVGYTNDNSGFSTRGPNGNETMFPKFGGPVSAVQRQDSADETWAAGGLQDEKTGTVEHRGIDVKGGDERSSSYGYLDGKS